MVAPITNGTRYIERERVREGTEETEREVEKKMEEEQKEKEERCKMEYLEQCILLVETVGSQAEIQIGR